MLANAFLGVAGSDWHLRASVTTRLVGVDAELVDGSLQECHSFFSWKLGWRVQTTLA